MSIFEVLMLACFGAAWPINIVKSYRSRTAAGRSLTFQWAIILGYICGITHKILYSNDIVLYMYVINLVMVGIDTFLYFRNRRLDMERSKTVA